MPPHLPPGYLAEALPWLPRACLAAIGLITLAAGADTIRRRRKGGR
jgi:hypothetical protein